MSILAASSVARGQLPRTSGASAPKPAPTARRIDTLSQYERDVLKRVLDERHLELEPNPEGKSVEAIDIEPLEVFEPADPIPGWTNWFHTTSRAAIIEREVLIRAGQEYDQRLIDETARNLRYLIQLSLVLVVPVKAADRERVRLLVITKDVWSLRPNWDISVRNSVIERLFLKPSEENFAGRHLQLGGLYQYDLSTNTFGINFADHRLYGSRIRFELVLNAIQYRKTGEIEGSSGALVFGQPLYSTRTKWAWGTSLAWDDHVTRMLLPTGGGTYQPRLYRDRATPELPAVPYEYRARILKWQTLATRSFGYEFKSNLSVGLEAQQRSFDASGLIAQGYPEAAVRRFEQNALEHKSARIGPFVQLENFRNRFISMLDVETLGLQEDIQLGSRGFIKVYSGTKRAMATRDLVGVATGLQYSVSVSDSLFRIWAVHTSEVTPNHVDDDGLIQTGVRLVSPRLPLGRFVYDGNAAYHYQNNRNLRYELGGDTRLRGYPSGQFLGHHVIVSNLEFRTRPLKLLEVLFGLVAFYDLGDAFDSMNQLRPKHSVGIGGRATFPQLQRAVGRLDLAFPLTAPTGPNERWGSAAVFLTLEQAFPLPMISAPR